MVPDICNERTVMSKLALYWSVYISIAMLCVPHGFASENTLPQFQGCSVDETRCLENVYYMHCADRGTGFESCLALAQDLLAQRKLTPTTAVGDILGQVYYRLAQMALFARAEEVEEQYRARAREIFLDVIAKDKSAANSYLMLSVIDNDSVEVSLDWKRKAVELDQKWANSLATKLVRTGTADGIAEAIEVVQTAYSKAAPGKEKWRSASYAYATFESIKFQYPNLYDSRAADKFVARVRRDSKWNLVSRILEDPTSAPRFVSDALQTSCGLTDVFGDELCLRAGESVVQAVLDAPNSAYAQTLADAAATGMQAHGGGHCMVDCPDYNTPRVKQLEQFVKFGLDSLAVLEAIATISRDPDQWLEARREIVARYQDNGEARFQLGKVYYDQKRWAEAIVQLEFAIELSPPEDQYFIANYLRQASIELELN